TAQASYSRTTGNFAPSPGSVPSGLGQREATFDTSNFWSGSIQASQLLWDFDLTLGRWRAARESARASEDSERATDLTVVLGVRTAFFNARAQKALVQVARETLANQERHLQQIQGF